MQLSIKWRDSLVCILGHSINCTIEDFAVAANFVLSLVCTIPCLAVSYYGAAQKYLRGSLIPELGKLWERDTK